MADSSRSKTKRTPKRARREEEDPFAPTKWKGDPPPFCISILGLRGQSRRFLLDVETNPRLTPVERDHLLEVVIEYLNMVGRADGLVAGFARADDEVKADAGLFEVKKRNRAGARRPR